MIEMRSSRRRRGGRTRRTRCSRSPVLRRTGLPSSSRPRYPRAPRLRSPGRRPRPCCLAPAGEAEEPACSRGQGNRSRRTPPGEGIRPPGRRPRAGRYRGRRPARRRGGGGRASLGMLQVGEPGITVPYGRRQRRGGSTGGRRDWTRAMSSCFRRILIQVATSSFRPAHVSAAEVPRPGRWWPLPGVDVFVSSSNASPGGRGREGRERRHRTQAGASSVSPPRGRGGAPYPRGGPPPRSSDRRPSRRENVRSAELAGKTALPNLIRTHAINSPVYRLAPEEIKTTPGRAASRAHAGEDAGGCGLAAEGGEPVLKAWGMTGEERARPPTRYARALGPGVGGVGAAGLLLRALAEAPRAISSPARRARRPPAPPPDHP